MIDRRLKIWFFKAERLTDLKHTLSFLFDCDFEQDYENIWEWLDGYSKTYHVNVNISRAHENWQSSGFKNPTMILLNPDDFNFNSLALIEMIAKELFAGLGVEIYYGHSTINDDDKYEYIELGKIVSKSL